MKLSFVIPCYRSEALVSSVISEIRDTVGQKYDFEIIAVDDCSPDSVLDVLKALAKTDQKLKVIGLAKNMGKHAALMAGFAHTTGDIIIDVDDDGQCPLDRLWDLLDPLFNGYDASIARYPQKKQAIWKNFGSALNYKMACFLLDKPKKLALSNFSAFKAFVIKEILRYRHSFPYIDGLLLRTTQKIANVDMEERERLAGTSGYTLFKSIKLFADGFTAFSVKPLRVATVVGFFSALVGFLYGIITIIRKIAMPGIAAGYSSLMAVILFIGGILMLILGLLGEYVGRIYICMNNSPQYVIRETVNIDDRFSHDS